MLTVDRITVIRDGSPINIYFNPEKNIDLDPIARDMVGRPVELFYKKEICPIGDVVFEVNNLKLTKDSPEVSFDVREGEILGIAGMVGSGRTEIANAIAGAQRKFSGTIKYKDKELKINKAKR